MELSLWSSLLLPPESVSIAWYRFLLLRVGGFPGTACSPMTWLDRDLDPDSGKSRNATYGFLGRSLCLPATRGRRSQSLWVPVKRQPAFLSAADIRHCSALHLSPQNLFFSELPLFWPPCPMLTPSKVLSASLRSVTSPAALLMIFLCLPLTSHHLFLYYFLPIPHIFSVFSLFAPPPPLPFSTLFYHLCS